MNPELKKRWVEALRSGKYQQGEGYLRSKDDEYCCLGVLCDIQGAQWQDGGSTAAWDVEGELYFTPDKVMLDVGLEFRHAQELANRNDGSDGYHPHTFEEIANWIEENL